MHPREKARLYHDLGELLRSGVTFHRAIEKLAQHAQGATSSVMRGLSTAVSAGATMPEALAAQPQINGLDAALFTASDRAGMLDHGFALASEYYAALAEARSTMWTRAAYPLFILHFAFLAFNVTKLVNGDGLGEFARAVLAAWAVLWAALVTLIVVGKFLTRAAARSATLDHLLGFIPLVGKLRRAFALSRFSAAFDMQLEAAVNAFDTLSAAAKASASAVIVIACDRALGAVRAGEKVGDALAATHAFPESFTRAFLVGEETGRLDHELRHLASEYRKSAFKRLEAIAEWVPRMLYIGVLIYIGYMVVGWYGGYLKGLNDILK